MASSLSHLPAPFYPMAVAIMQLASDYASEALIELSTIDTSGDISTNKAPRPTRLRSPLRGTSSRVVKRETSDKDTEDSEGDEKNTDAGVKNAEAARVTVRARRITLLVGLVEAAHHTATGQAHPGAFGSAVMHASAAQYGSRAAGAVVSALGDCFAKLTGAEPLSTKACSYSGGALYGSGQQPLTRSARPVALPEAALALYALNTRTVFRRRSTGNHASPFTESSASATAMVAASASMDERNDRGSSSCPRKRGRHTSLFTLLSEEQRGARFAVYASRRALLPRLDNLDAALRSQPANAMTSATFFAVSPAIRELSALNMNAERRMLAHAWCITTKASLLVRLPALWAAVRTLREKLSVVLTTAASDDGKDNHLSAGAGSGVRVPFWVFTHSDKGVVRVCVQGALWIDITLDLESRRWTLLRLHWDLWGPPLATAADDDALLAALHCMGDAERKSTGNGTAETIRAQKEAVGHDESVCADLSLLPHRLVPNHQDAMRGYVQAQLVDGGLEAALTGASRLLGAYAMDIIARQARRLQSHLLSPPLHKALMVDVRQGTHVSLIAGPPLTRGNQLMMKYFVTAGTIVLETAWTGGGGDHGGASTSRGHNKRTVECVLLRREENGGVVIDVEARLWESLLGA